MPANKIEQARAALAATTVISNDTKVIARELLGFVLNAEPHTAAKALCWVIAHLAVDEANCEGHVRARCRLAQEMIELLVDDQLICHDDRLLIN